MSKQERKTLVCPSCGNVNPYTADECIKCGLALGPIREAPARASMPPAEKAPMSSEAKQKPPEYTPQFVQQLRFVDRWQAVIPSMATKADEVKQEFLKRVGERGFANLSISPGQIEVEKQRRDYEFITLTLDPQLDARAIAAVRIAPFANDLAVEWRHYELPPYTPQPKRWLILVIGGIFGAVLAIWGPWGLKFGLGFFLFFALLALIPASRNSTLQGFQPQDSWAFRESVDQILRETLDMVGISAEMIREMPKEKRAI